MLLILEHKIRCLVVISMVFTGKVDVPVFITFTIESTIRDKSILLQGLAISNLCTEEKFLRIS